MAKILIAGFGKIGRPLANQLAETGHRVVGIKRSSDDIDIMHTGVSWRQIDLTQPGLISTLEAGFDQLIIILTPESRSPEGYRRIYQVALNHLLDTAAGWSHPPKIIFVSATSVYGQVHGEWVDEDSETAPQTYNGQSLLTAERDILRYGEDNIVVRFSGIYGNARTRVLDQLKAGSEVQIDPPTFTNRIHQDDCVGVLGFLSEKQLNQEPLQSIYLASDHHPAPRYEVMSWLATATGLPGPIAITASNQSEQNKRCNNQRLLKLGYQFKYPSYKEGYQTTLEQKVN